MAAAVLLEHDAQSLKRSIFNGLVLKAYKTLDDFAGALFACDPQPL
jgi:hypothetical protein